jgi:hypothetical protein
MNLAYATPKLRLHAIGRGGLSTPLQSIPQPIDIRISSGRNYVSLSAIPFRNARLTAKHTVSQVTKEVK